MSAASLIVFAAIFPRAASMAHPAGHRVQCPCRAGGCSSMVEPQLPKLMTWVRFPSPAPLLASVGTIPFRIRNCREDYALPNTYHGRLARAARANERGQSCTAPDRKERQEQIMTESTAKPRTVFVVDDHPIVRQGLVQLIEQEPDLKVCGEAADVKEARASLSKVVPDIVILDLSLRDSDGLELVKDIRSKYQQLPVLVLSMHDESIYAERLLSAGANG